MIKTLTLACALAVTANAACDGKGYAQCIADTFAVIDPESCDLARMYAWCGNANGGSAECGNANGGVSAAQSCDNIKSGPRFPDGECVVDCANAVFPSFTMTSFVCTTALVPAADTVSIDCTVGLIGPAGFKPGQAGFKPKMVFTFGEESDESDGAISLSTNKDPSAASAGTLLKFTVLNGNEDASEFPQDNVPFTRKLSSTVSAAALRAAYGVKPVYKFRAAELIIGFWAPVVTTFPAEWTTTLELTLPASDLASVLAKVEALEASFDARCNPSAAAAQSMMPAGRSVSLLEAGTTSPCGSGDPEGPNLSAAASSATSPWLHVCIAVAAALRGMQLF